MCRREKYRIHRILHFDYSEKEVMILAGKTPYWLTFNSNEKVENINKLVKKMWLYYEPAICKKIIEITEPILQQTKPIFISSLKFKKITFGDVPFTITYIKILEEDTVKITFEAGIRYINNNNFNILHTKFLNIRIHTYFNVKIAWNLNRIL